MYFIFNWEVEILYNKPIIIGFGYDSDLNEKVALIIKNYPMYKYSKNYEVQYSNKSYKKYLLRNYLAGKQNVYKISFSKYKEYKQFSSDLLNIDIVSSFLVDQDLDTIGWIRVDDNGEYNTGTKYTTINNEYIVNYHNIHKVECNIYPDCSILSFDIECMSHDLISFPSFYQFDDYISTISIIYQHKNVNKSIAICYKKLPNNNNTQNNNNSESEFNSNTIDSKSPKYDSNNTQDIINNLNSKFKKVKISEEIYDNENKENINENLINEKENINNLNFLNTKNVKQTNLNELEINLKKEREKEKKNNNKNVNETENKIDNESMIKNEEITKIIYVSSELALLKEFFNQIRILDPDIIIGYNIFGFDYRYISRRAGMFLKEKFNASRILNMETQFNDLTCNRTEIYNPGRLNIDMYEYAKSLNLPVSSLNYISEKLLNKKKIDLPYLKMFELIDKGDEKSLQEVAKYCIMDSQLTLDIFEVSHQWIQLLEIAKISRIRIDDIYKLGQSIKFTNLLYQYCYKSDICIDIDKEKVYDYPGATVLEPNPGVYDLCSMLDFTSLYPSVIITHNICYTTFLNPDSVKNMNKDDYHEIDLGDKIYYYTKAHEGILPRMLKILLSERIKFKNLMKTATGIDKIIYDKRQWALKIQANSIYGCLGSKTLQYLRFLPGAECTTGMGRNYLNKAIQLIEETPFDIIYGDTDSCLIKCDIIKDPELFIKNSIRVAEYVTSNLPEGMHLKYENTFIRLIIISKKKYSGILVNTDHKLYTKGMDTVKKNNSHYIKDSYQSLVNMILEGKSSTQIRKHVLNLKKDLLEGRVPMEKLIMKLTISRKYKSKSFYVIQFLANHKKYNFEYKVGTKVDYLIINSLIPEINKHPKRLGDKVISIDLYNYFKENNSFKLPTIDYEYYYNHYMKSSLALLLRAFDSNILNIL